MPVKVIYSYLHPRPAGARIELPPSITVPSQTMSVRTIMERYARGMPLDIRVHDPVYNDGLVPDLTNLDLSEIAELKRAVADQVQQYQHDLQEQEDDAIKQRERELTDKITELQQQLENGRDLSGPRQS